MINVCVFLNLANALKKVQLRSIADIVPACTFQQEAQRMLR